MDRGPGAKKGCSLRAGGRISEEPRSNGEQSGRLSAEQRLCKGDGQSDVWGIPERGPKMTTFRKASLVTHGAMADPPGSREEVGRSHALAGVHQ